MNNHKQLAIMNNPSKKGLLVNILASLLFVFAINGLIFALGWNDSNSQQNELTPPGYVIGIVWVVLFAILGYLRWRVIADTTQRRLVTALIAACALYPFYTAGLGSQLIGLIGNLLTLAFAYFVFYKLQTFKRQILLVPLLAWLTFAAYLTATNLPS